MAIYTASYATYRGDRGVQISTSKPKDYPIRKSLPPLYPDWPEVAAWNEVKHLPESDPKRIAQWNHYVEVYWAKLNRIGISRILSLLSDGDVLLCWCKDPAYCHRGLIAKYLTWYGIEVREFTRAYPKGTLAPYVP